MGFNSLLKSFSWTLLSFMPSATMNSLRIDSRVLMSVANAVSTNILMVCWGNKMSWPMNGQRIKLRHHAPFTGSMTWKCSSLYSGNASWFPAASLVSKKLQWRSFYKMLVFVKRFMLNIYINASTIVTENIGSSPQIFRPVSSFQIAYFPRTASPLKALFPNFTQWSVGNWKKLGKVKRRVYSQSLQQKDADRRNG